MTERDEDEATRDEHPRKEEPRGADDARGTDGTTEGIDEPDAAGPTDPVESSEDGDAAETPAAEGDGEDGEDDEDDEYGDIEIVGFSAADAAGVAIEDPDELEEDEDDEEIVVLDDEDDGDDGESLEPRDVVSSEEAERLRRELEEARAEAEELKQRLLRQAAEADNFRKRVERERVEERKQAAASLVRDLLPILDNFERALEQGREAVTQDEAVGGFFDGFRLIEEQLSDILRRAGLEPVDASGVFDPNVHEALMQEPTSDAPHLSILKVFEKGWRLQGRLLRPARVVVASNPSQSASATAAADGGMRDEDASEPAGQAGNAETGASESGSDAAAPSDDGERPSGESD